VPSHGTRFKLETQVSQAAPSHTIHSEFKTISPYLFPLKSQLALNPGDQNHISPRRRGCITLESYQGSAGPLWRISLHWLLTLTTPGLLPGPDIWCRSLFHSTSLKAWSLASQPPSVVWKETPESHWGCAIPSSSNLRGL
jgi:hypothetical protein